MYKRFVQLTGIITGIPNDGKLMFPFRTVQARYSESIDLSKVLCVLQIQPQRGISSVGNISPPTFHPDDRQPAPILLSGPLLGFRLIRTAIRPHPLPCHHLKGRRRYFQIADPAALFVHRRPTGQIH